MQKPQMATWSEAMKERRFLILLFYQGSPSKRKSILGYIKYLF